MFVRFVMNLKKYFDSFKRCDACFGNHTSDAFEEKSSQTLESNRLIQICENFNRFAAVCVCVCFFLFSHHRH